MINQVPTRSSGQGGWVTGMAILGLAMPLVGIWLSRGVEGVLTQPAGTADYRATVAALVIGMAGSIVALLGGRALLTPWRRWLVIAMAGLGLLVGAYILWMLVGLCGLQVLWGICRP